MTAYSGNMISDLTWYISIKSYSPLRLGPNVDKTFSYYPKGGVE